MYEVFEAMGSQVSQAHAVWKVMLYQVAGSLRQHHLASVACAHDACGPMHVQSYIAFSGTLWLARMQTHTHMHSGTIGPGMGSQRTLHLYCRAHRISGACKGHKEGIALGVHLVAVPAVKGSTQEVAARGEDTIIAVAYLQQQAGGAFNIGEEQSDRSRLQFTHAAPLAIGDTSHSRASWTTGLSDVNRPLSDRRRHSRCGQSS